MTTPTLSIGAPELDAPTVERIDFRRIAGVAGLVAIAVGVTQTVVVGDIPAVGDSAERVAAYYATDRGAHSFGVVAAALLGIPIALFLVGVHRTLRSTAWATAFLYGAVMMSVTAGAAEALRGMLALRGGAGLDAEVVRTLNDGALVADATLGVWIALATGSVAAATFLDRVHPRWYGWLCLVAATLGVLAVIDTVSTTNGGALAQLAFGVGVIVWTTVSSLLLIRGRR